MSRFRHILIIADIEGSSGCFNYDDSRFLTSGWASACVDMSRDVDAVCRSLFQAGAVSIAVKDFHRTGYNLLPELIDPRARIIHGYKRGPVMGLGDPLGARAVMFLGLHAPSGSDGFLAHTLTSRIARLDVNGRLLSEVELFSASLAPHGVRPIFFSGCPVACEYAEKAISRLPCYPIDKSGGRDSFDAPRWRSGLAEAAVLAYRRADTAIFEPGGPFRAAVSLRDGPRAAARLGRRWRLPVRENRIFLECRDIHQLYFELARLVYLNRWTARALGPSLWTYNRLGQWGLSWVRRRHRLNKPGTHDAMA